MEITKEGERCYTFGPGPHSGSRNRSGLDLLNQESDQWYMRQQCALRTGFSIRGPYEYPPGRPLNGWWMKRSYDQYAGPKRFRSQTPCMRHEASGLRIEGLPDGL